MEGDVFLAAKSGQRLEIPRRAAAEVLLPSRLDICADCDEIV